MEEGSTATYSVQDADPSAVEAMLRYIYTGEAFAPGSELDPSPLLELAIVYQVNQFRFSEFYFDSTKLQTSCAATFPGVSDE